MNIFSSLLDIKSYFADENYEIPNPGKSGGSVITHRGAPIPQFRQGAILSSAGTGEKVTFILRTKAASLLHVRTHRRNNPTIICSAHEENNFHLKSNSDRSIRCAVRW
jgi:hypothetical protein